MKKKIIALITVCLLLLSLAGFSAERKYANPYEHIGKGYFGIIREWKSDYTDYCIVYDYDTNVKYLVMRGKLMSGITPLYNADGTLQIYDENDDDK